MHVVKYAGPKVRRKVKGTAKAFWWGATSVLTPMPIYTKGGIWSGCDSANLKQDFEAVGGDLWKALFASVSTPAPPLKKSA